jgi:hypothetical protein
VLTAKPRLTDISEYPEHALESLKEGPKVPQEDSRCTPESSSPPSYRARGNNKINSNSSNELVKDVKKTVLNLKEAARPAAAKGFSRFITFKEAKIFSSTADGEQPPNS